MCLVTLSTGMRSSSGVSMVPALVLRRVKILDLDLCSERDCHAMDFYILKSVI